MGKIGRNDPCPCGSGKKYKKCCIKKNISFPVQGNKKKKKPFLAQYKKCDKIKLFAGLQAHAQNHGKNVRLEELVEDSIESKGVGKQPLDLSKIDAYLSKAHSFHYMEDPPVNLFTEVIIYHGGDYLVFSGIIEWGRYVLQNMLNAFHYASLSIPDEFRMICEDVTLFFLNISDKIVQSIGYERYTDAIIDSDSIFVPKKVDAQKLMDAVTFSREEIEGLAASIGFDLDMLELFICPNNPKAHKNQYSGDPISLEKPFYWCNDELIVISPCAIIYAIGRFIWKAASIHKCLIPYNEAYHEILLQNNMMNLKTMGWKEISFKDFPAQEQGLSIKERLLKFDDDKVAYLTFHYNDRQNSGRDVTKRQEEVVAWLNTKLKGWQIFNMNLIAVTGDNRGVMVAPIAGSLTFMIQSPELEMISQSRGHNNLTLWKFAQARNELGKALFSINTIDSYSMYKENGYSFYVSDERRPDFMLVNVGEGGAFQRKIVKDWNLHSIRRIVDGHIVCVPCVSRKDSSKTYYPLSSIGVTLEQVVEGFPMPIWVEPVCDIFEEEVPLRMFYLELNEGICYWLWQMQPFINKELQVLGNKPITIKYEFIDKDEWKDLSAVDLERKTDIESLFKLSIDNRNIVVKIPIELAAYLYGRDNEGERRLLRVLLESFNLFASKNNIPKLFSQEKIGEVVENAAPLGFKKKVFMLDTSADLRLDPTELVPHRYVQQHDVNVVLDTVLSKLDKIPKLTPESEKKDKSQFIIKVVTKALLPWLKNELSRYDSQELLKRLLALNESAIHRRERLRLLTPLKIACFVSKEEEMKTLHEELMDLDITSTSLRCLIEHLGAEQYTGTKIISDETIDLIVAIMSKIITWGMIGDFIHLGLIDIELSVLLSGRLGTNFHEVAQPMLEAYKLSKVEEDVTDSESYAQGIFDFDEEIKNESGISVPEGIENGFEEAYGLTLTTFNSFMYWAAIVGLNVARNTNSSCIVLTRSDLKKEMEKVSGQTIMGSTYDAFISNFSISDRGKVDKLPKGDFDFFDISPWRYNRRLSLLRRPFIIVESSVEGKEPSIYYGFRQVMLSSMYVKHMIFEARLRVPDGSKLDKALGKRANKRGEEFVQEVLQTLSSIGSESIVVDDEVDIKPNKQFHADKDLGDIDVLVIDTHNKMIFSIECKKMLAGKNPKEMVEEADKLIGSGNDGWISKHVKRDEWLKDNIDLVESRYNLDLSGFTIKSLFMTSEALSSSFTKKNELALPFTTIYHLRRDGIQALIDCE